MLLVSPDPVAPSMAGPGIRYLELGRALAAEHDVTLAAPVGSRPVEGAPDLALYDPDRPRTLWRLFGPRQVLVAPPLPPALLSTSALRGVRWIVDLYNPEPFEGLEYRRTRPRLERRLRDIARIDRVGFAARRGTAFVCGTERQRDMWLGFLAASRRLDSDRYAHDAQLRALIDVVPFGLPSEGPRPAPRPVLRGRLLPASARIMVWGGGIWDWLDPLTVLRALALLRADDPEWALAFVATTRPGGEEHAMAARAIRLASELGLREGEAVHFRLECLPYADRGALLLEADMGVSAHGSTLEARFAHRARFFDYVWAGLPVLCTEGDDWSARVVAEGLGEAVAPADPHAFAEAARRIAHRGRGAYDEVLRAAAASRSWHVAAEPLRRLITTVTDTPRPRRDLAAAAFALRYTAASIAERALRRPAAALDRATARAAAAGER